MKSFRPQPAWAMHLPQLALLLLVMGLADRAAAADPAPANATPGIVASNQLADNSSLPLPAPPSASATTSVAEQITRLERTMATDSERLVKLRAEIVGPMSEYRLAESAYKATGEQLALAVDELNCLRDGGDMNAVAAIATEIEELTAKEALALERFDLAIQTRKTLQEQIAALEAKRKQDQQALDRLTGAVPATPAPTESASATATPAADAAAPVKEIPVAPLENGMASLALLPTAKAASKELVEAESEAQLKTEAAKVAERDAESVSDRVLALEKDIELENRLLVAARKKSDLAYQAGETIEGVLERKTREGAPASELQALQEKRRDSATLFNGARLEVRERTDRLIALQTQRAELQHEELRALTEAREKQAAADLAHLKVSELKNPFSANNLLQWLLDHGPKVSFILLAMTVLRWVVSLASYRVVSLMIMRGARGTRQEREDRARTLVGVFHNAASVTLVISGVLMICEEVGIAVGPLMGGAAVLGLAIAFGAQNLIRDYFYGFVILMENQYKLNDVLRIGAIAGQVEQITLRMTVLRDLEGNVHFIPNGKIDSVTNMTHGWSRAVMEVAVPYRENTDRVMELLMEIARDLHKEEAFRGLVIDDPEMLGVESLGDSAVTIKFMIKTRPASKWAVRREMLRRIKRRFDELGISAPFPQRVVHHLRDADAPTDDETLPDEQAWPRKKSA